MNQKNFIDNLNEAWELKSRVDFLSGAMDKTIKEVFRDNGITVMDIKILPKGFTCKSRTSGISYDMLQNIMKNFSKFTLEITKYGDDFFFKFNLKS